MSDTRRAAPSATLLLDEAQCIGCAVCADVCPTGALVMARASLYPDWEELKCTYCSLCERQCPTGAVTIAGVGLK